MSSRGSKEWTSEGFEKYAEWSKDEFCKFYIFGDWFRLLNNHVLDPTNDDDSSDEDSEVGKDAIPEIILDEHGFATLPSRKEVSLKGQQELVRQIFYASYSESLITSSVDFNSTQLPFFRSLHWWQKVRTLALDCQQSFGLPGSRLHS
jgi:hypothetical protein